MFEIKQANFEIILFIHLNKHLDGVRWLKSAIVTIFQKF